MKGFISALIVLIMVTAHVSAMSVADFQTTINNQVLKVKGMGVPGSSSSLFGTKLHYNCSRAGNINIVQTDLRDNSTFELVESIHPIPKLFLRPKAVF